MTMLASADKYDLIELPHHDYLGLVQSRRLLLDQFNHIAIALSNLSIAIARNSNRTTPIPESYIKTCHTAAMEFITDLKKRSLNYSLIDTNKNTPEKSASLLVDFLHAR